MTRGAPLRAIALIAVSLAACAPRVEERGPPVQRPVLLPDRVVMADGANLPLSRWLPEGETRATLVALNGFTDYSNAFARAGAYFAEHGIAVYAYDQRGFGAAPGRGLWPGTEAFVSDLREVVSLVDEAHPGSPIFLLGESMGAAVAMVAMALPDAPAVDGLILVAPAVWGWQVMHPLLAGLLRSLAHLIPVVPVPVTAFRARASDNRAMLEALDHDPLVVNAVRIDSLYGLVNLMDEVLTSAGQIESPTLLLHGANERLIPASAFSELLRRLEAVDRMALYPDGYHTLLRDLNAAVVLDDVMSWVLRAKPCRTAHRCTSAPLRPQPYIRRAVPRARCSSRLHGLPNRHRPGLLCPCGSARALPDGPGAAGPHGQLSRLLSAGRQHFPLLEERGPRTARHGRGDRPVLRRLFL